LFKTILSKLCALMRVIGVNASAPKMASDLGEAEHLRAQWMVMRQMMRVFALPREMTFSAYQSDCPRAEEAVPVCPMMTIDTRTATDQAPTFVSDVDLPSKFLPTL
jgi:hypothetical protein